MNKKYPIRTNLFLFAIVLTLAPLFMALAAGAQEDMQQERKQQQEQALDQAASQDKTETPQQPEGQKEVLVTDIKIEGNHAIGTDTILLKIKTGVGRALIQKQLNDDIKSLYATGLFTDVSAQQEDYKNGERIIFYVVEKAIIKKVTFQGNDSINERILSKEIETKKDDVLSNSVLAADIKKIKAYYHKKGFVLVEVSYNTQIDKDNGASVTIIIDEKVKYKIKKIIFAGNNSFKPDALLKNMTTKTAGWFRSGVLDNTTLEEDIDKIKEFYQNNGFIDVEADSSIEYKNKEKGIYITININEGKKYTTGDISLSGNTVFSKDQLLKDLKLKKGTAYNPSELRNDVIKIQTLYFDKGYMNCKVSPDTLLDQKAQSINITYDISEDEVIYVDKISVTGNSKTKDVVIRRELRLYPGDKFDGSKLRRSKERLYNLGYFEEVIFDTEPTKSPDKKDLIVSVKEAKTGEFSFGGGFSSIERLIGFVEVTQKNFDLMNFPTFTGAGQNLTLRGTFGSVRRDYLLSFTEPWILGYPYSFGFDLYNMETLRKSELGYGYDESHRGGNLRLGKELTDYDRVDLKYRLEEVRIGDVPDDASSALKDEVGKNTISSMGLTLTRDTRDNKFNPINGYMLTGAVEDGGGIFGGDKDFLKFTSDNSVYFNYLDEKLVLELKGSAGWVNEYANSDRVPIYERFFAGGANTIRGYKERSIGPRDLNTSDPIGGEAVIVGNAELTYPLFQNFKIATFYDVGNVWEQSSDIGNGDFKSAVGVGTRIKTPIGPVKIDFGYPLNEAYPGAKKKGRVHFSMTRGF